MGDYFFEMGWEPVPLEDTQRHQNLLVIRELIANGLIRDDLAFDLPPPASKAVVAELKERTPQLSDECCTICLKPNADVDPADAKFIVLPCSHEFHKTCIMPWLEKVSEVLNNYSGHLLSILFCASSLFLYLVDQFLSSVSIRDANGRSHVRAVEEKQGKAEGVGGKCGTSA